MDMCSVAEDEDMDGLVGGWVSTGMTTDETVGAEGYEVGALWLDIITSDEGVG